MYLEATLPNIEIYGTKGTMLVPDPNGWRLRSISIDRRNRVDGRAAASRYNENTRGIGPADMAYAIRAGRAHRASGELAYHVLEAMWASMMLPMKASAMRWSAPVTSRRRSRLICRNTPLIYNRMI